MSNSGSEAGQQVCEAAAEAGEAVAQRQDKRGEARLAQEAPRDEGNQRGHDEAEPTGEVGGVGLDRGRDEGGFHHTYS